MKPNWFIGLPVSAGSWFSAVIAGVPHGVRVFHPLDLHLTVAFLGACSPSAARRGWDALEGSAHEAIEARLGGVRGMGNRRRPSAYSLTLAEGHGETAALSRILGQWRALIMPAAGAPEDPRPPLPHITVARPPRKADGAQRAAAQVWLDGQTIPPVTVKLDRVALYTWGDERGRRRFQIVAERPLDGG